MVSGGQVDENNDEWKKRNEKASHAIQPSCGPDVLSVKRKTGHASVAWSHLNGLFSPDLKGNPDNEKALI